MNTKQVHYMMNGTVVSLWRRITTSKTFWIAIAFILTAADRWNKGEISSADFFQMVQIGVIGILIRAALAKSELAANAANPDIAAVDAVERDSKLPPEIPGAAACLVVAGALLTLTACAGPGALLL